MALTLSEVLALRRGPAAPEVVERLPDKAVRCYSCAHRCKIPVGRDGICRVRSNVDGELLVPKGYVAGVQVDPIEKKPFFHALPGNDALSFGMLGCDLHCAYCFTAETRVATANGMERIGDLFDRGAPDPEGGAAKRVPREPIFVAADDGSMQPVKRLFRHSFAGEVVSVKTRFLPGFEVTPDHPVLATRDPGREAATFVAADELEPGIFLVLPRRHTHASERGAIDVAALLQRKLGPVRRGKCLETATAEKILELSAAGHSSREIGAALNRRADSVRHIRSRIARRGGDSGAIASFDEHLVFDEGRVRYGQERRPGIPVTLAVDARLAELFGLYCAEGRALTSKHRPSGRSLVFSFGLHEHPLAARTKALVEEIFGVPARSVDRETTRAITVSKTSVATVFSELCGVGAAGKRIPEAIHSAPRAVAEAFLAALVAGDGHRHADGKVSFTTVSEDLAWGVGWLLLRLGFLPSVYDDATPVDGEILGRAVRTTGRRFTVAWRERETTRRRWRADDACWYVPIRSVSRRAFEGFVYNLEADGRHTYLANLLAVHNCQNWVTSQALRDPVAGGSGPQDVRPEQLVALALRERAPVVVSTYNEPLITSEWAVSVLKPAKEKGLLGAFVSNGNATEQVLDYIRPYVSLYKIDLKSFTDKRYRELGAPLEHILDGIRMVHAKGFWLEVVTLVIPGFNDSEAELREAARFLRSVSPDIPWHVTGFHDDYKMDRQGDTPARTLIRACEIGVAEGLRFVYAGNRPGQVGEWENTRCPSCTKTLIRRSSFRILEDVVGKGGTCPSCGTKIPGVWDHPLARPRAASAPATPRRVF